MNISVLIYFLLSSFLLDRRLNKFFPGVFYIGVGLIFLFMALRYGYGNDYFHYFHMHNYFHLNGIGEFGFEYFYKFINIVSNEYQFVIFTQSALFLFAFFYLGKALKSYQCNFFLVALLFFLNPYLYLMHLSALRQSMAICSFVLFFSCFLVHKKYIFYVLMLVVPVLFHKASLVYLIIPLVLFYSNFFYKQKLFFKFFLIVVLVPIIYVFLGNSLIGILSKYSFYYEQYIGSSISVTTFAYILFIGVFFLISKPKFDIEESGQSIYKVLHMMVFISLIFSVVSLTFPMFSRVTLFFDFFIPFYFASSRFIIKRYYIYTFLIIVNLIRNYTFLNSEIWYNGFGSYGVFFL